MSSPSTYVYFNLWCNWVTKRILSGQKPIESLVPCNSDLHHSLSPVVWWMSIEDKPWSLNLIFPLNLFQLICDIQDERPVKLWDNERHLARKHRVPIWVRMLEIRTEISYCLIMAGWKCLRKINLNVTHRTRNYFFLNNKSRGWQLYPVGPLLLYRRHIKNFILFHYLMVSPRSLVD